MDNTAAAIDTLKRALKLNGYTYADAARHLGLSEASVKRMFSTHHITLDRISRLCGMMGMDFIDLLRLFESERQRISHLSLEQEQELVRDKQLLLVAVCARNHYSFDEIIGQFAIERAEVFRLLRRLEELQLLELHPGNRIRLRVAGDFRWLPDGPIERYFEQKLAGEFLEHGFDAEDGVRLYLHGPLTQGAREQLKRRIDALSREFAELLKESAARPISERENIGLMLAMRPWEPAFVHRCRRTDTAV
jgi:AraC-like DNA-binding protein